MTAPTKTRADAWRLLTQWTKNKRLLKHALAVEAALLHYATVFNQDQQLWGIVGLLHDFDYERYPSLQDHPYQGQAILAQAGYSDTIRRAIMAHAPHTGTARVTKLEQAVFAVDELTGFIVAIALVKPHKTLAEVDVNSIRKKMRQKTFATAVKREDFIIGARELGLPLNQHIQHVLSAMQNIADDLGL